MIQFALWLKEPGEGCDYTIGCGEKLLLLKSATAEDVEEEIRERLEYYGFPSRDLATVKLFKLVHEYDVETLKDEMLPEDVEDEATAARRRKYEELKREFG